MGTMSDSPHLHFYGSSDFPGSIEGRLNVRAFYEEALSQPYAPMGLLPHRICVAEQAITLEAEMILSQQQLEAGFPSVAAEFKGGLTAFYAAKRVCIVLPYEGELIRGAVHYFDGPISPDDVEFAI